MVKTEYREEYLMKRFGGIEFLPLRNTTMIQIVNESMINQLNTLGNRTNATADMVNAALVVPLFRVYPPQVSVTSSSSAA